jgi:hypothetical protein
MVSSLQQFGLIYPLMLHKGRVVDGKERLGAAIKLGIEEVPCVEICEGDLHSVILHSLTARKHLTKSAVAYLAYPHLAKTLEESKKRRGPNSPFQMAEELAESLGISRSLFFLARNIHGHFDKDPAMRAYFEPRILHGEPNADDVDDRRAYSLGRVRQGIERWYAAKNLNKQPGKQPEYAWTEKLSGFMDKRKFAGWDKLSDKEQQQVITRVVLGVLHAWPEKLLRSVVETYEAEKGARL